MLRKFTIAVFEGDGIGPEVIGPTVEILARLAEQSRCYQLSFDSLPAGAAHFLETGESLPKTSLEAARDADAILLSAMGLPDVRHADGTEITPQVQMSEAFELFAGVRPVRVPAPKVSAIKIPRDKTVDFVMVRENTEGLFFSQAKGDVGPNAARETLQITRKTSQALFAFAFGYLCGQGQCVPGLRLFPCDI